MYVFICMPCRYEVAIIVTQHNKLFSGCVTIAASHDVAGNVPFLFVLFVHMFFATVESTVLRNWYKNVVSRA